MKRHPKPTPEQDEALKSHQARQVPIASQWLANFLYEKAAHGDRHARTMLAKLSKSLRGWGARIPEPTWHPIWHKSRIHELDS
jgi:hypothetical protein